MTTCPGCTLWNLKIKIHDDLAGTDQPYFDANDYPGFLTPGGTVQTAPSPSNRVFIRVYPIGSNPNAGFNCVVDSIKFKSYDGKCSYDAANHCVQDYGCYAQLDDITLYEVDSDGNVVVFGGRTLTLNKSDSPPEERWVHGKCDRNEACESFGLFLNGSDGTEYNTTFTVVICVTCDICCGE